LGLSLHKRLEAVSDGARWISDWVGSIPDAAVLVSFAEAGLRASWCAWTCKGAAEVIGEGDIGSFMAWPDGGGSVQASRNELDRAGRTRCGSVCRNEKTKITPPFEQVESFTAQWLF